MLTIEPRASLADIQLRELTDAPAVALPRTRFLAGAGGEARGAPPLRDFATLVTREIRDLWQLRLPPGTSPAALDVAYDLVSASGREDRMSHRERADSEIRVRLEPIAPQVLEIDGGGTLIQGGVALLLDVAPARTAGSYAGTLTATITHF